MPPKYKSWAVCLYIRPTASMRSGGARVILSGVHKRIVSVLFSDTVRPASLETITMTVIILASPSANFETIPASAAHNMPHTALCTHADGSCSSAPTTPASSSRTKRPTINSSLTKRTSTMWNETAKKTLNSYGDSTQPCRSPCVTSNHSECSPSSVRT